MISAKKYLIIFSIVLAAAIIFVVLAERTNPPTRRDGRIRVTASFYPLYYFASRIGGEYADVAAIVPAGAEPHEYEPTPRDLARLAQSRVILLNGAGFEPWADAARLATDPQKTLVVAAGETGADREMTEDGKNVTDPHVWLDPGRASHMADIIRDAFIAADQARRDAYDANTAVLREDLRRLDRAYRDGLASCRSRDIVTSHAAFGYLADAYDLNQIAIAGFSGDEPQPAALAGIVRIAAERGVKTVFFETLASPRISETVAREIGGRVMTLNPIEGLTDAQIRNGDDYFSVMRENLAHLKTALSCE